MPETFSTVHTVFTGILLQALPFLLVGALLSSALHIFVPKTYFIKFFPRKYGLGFLTALFAGLVFPVCECASVPLMRSLIKKGVAMPMAVTFMLASPIVNPISILSTVYAFPQQPSVFLYRLYFGLTIALVIGLILLFYPEKKYLRDELNAAEIEPQSTLNEPRLQNESSGGILQAAFYLAMGRTAAWNRVPRTATSDRTIERRRILLRQLRIKCTALLMHTGSEFFTAGPFLIVGAFITALIRTAIPQEFFTITSRSPAGSLLLMMLFSFLFSACSTSDAFIARSFLNRFPFGSLFGFLVYGPMMDIKNLFMLLSLFKKRFVIELTVIITAVNFIGISIFVHLFL